MRTKRVLLPEAASAHSIAPINKSKRISTKTREMEEVGRLIVQSGTEKHALIIQLDRNFFIGRSSNCDFVIESNTVSSVHCKLYALRVDSGETIVAMTDLSVNGILYNQKRLKSTVILNNGDLIEIGQTVFEYVHSSEPGYCSQLSQGIKLNSKIIGDYIILDRLLGTGAFCVVRLALNKYSLKQVACKELKRSQLSSPALKVVHREIQILKQLHHPNINKIEEIGIQDEKIFIFLQLVSGGDLFNYLSKKTKLIPAEAKFITFQLLLAIRYLHQNNISHRELELDIKLENVILDGPGPFPKVLLADFGESSPSNDLFTSLAGTPPYMAPEILSTSLRNRGYEGKPTDIWSLGIILATLLIGYHPFDYPSNDSNIFAKIFGETGEIIESAEKTTCFNMIKNPLKLPLTQFGSHDLEVRNLLQNLLQKNPNFRLTAEKALAQKWFQVTRGELVEIYRFKFGLEPCGF